MVYFHCTIILPEANLIYLDFDHIDMLTYTNCIFVHLFHFRFEKFKNNLHSSTFNRIDVDIILKYNATVLNLLKRKRRNSRF